MTTNLGKIRSIEKQNKELLEKLTKFDMKLEKLKQEIISEVTQGMHWGVDEEQIVEKAAERVMKQLREGEDRDRRRNSLKI